MRIDKPEYSGTCKRQSRAGSVKTSRPRVASECVWGAWVDLPERGPHPVHLRSSLLRRRPQEIHGGRIRAPADLPRIACDSVSVHDIWARARRRRNRPA